MHVVAVEGEEEARGVDEGGLEEVRADEVVVAGARAGDLGGWGKRGGLGDEALHGRNVGQALGDGEGVPGGGGRHG